MARRRRSSPPATRFSIPGNAIRTATRGQLREVALRYLAGKPRVRLSVLGRKLAGRGAALDRGVAPPPAEPAGYRAPIPQIVTLRCGLPLWVFPRGDLPTVAGSIVITGGAGIQRLRQQGLAQLTADMLDEGTASRTAAQIAMAIEAMGASLAASCGWDGTYVGFRCLKHDLAAIKEAAPAGDVRIDVGTFKERFGITRKFAIPLLEYLDRERVTRRVGDTRVLL